MNNLLTRIETITPDLAKKYLATNKKNRKLRPRTVEDYKRQMINGFWDGLNGDTIKFDNNGNLIDGQHRLNAIIESGLTIQCLVVVGINGESFHTFDQGKKRTTCDILCLEGVENAALAAATANKIWKYERADFNFSSSRLSAIEVKDFIDRNPAIFDAIRFCHCKVSFMTKSILCLSYYICNKIDSITAEIFYGKLIDGANLKYNDPVYVLRERLLSLKNESKLRVSGYSSKIQLVFTTKCWNAARNGNTITKLAWNPDRDKFPTFI